MGWALIALAGCAVVPDRPAASSYECMKAVRDALPAGLDNKRAHCLADGGIAERCSVWEANLAGIGKEVRDAFSSGDASWADCSHEIHEHGSLRVEQAFTEQVALVTGAGSAYGIGFAIARRLHAAGARVVITSTTERIYERARELDEHEKSILAFDADLTSEAAAQRLVEAVLQRHHQIDILVNNAGMTQTDRVMEGRPLLHTTYADWQRQIEITLNTSFLMTRAVLPAMVARKYGRIVNVSSVTGPLVSNRGSAAYGAAKAAMDGMMRAVAIEMASSGITINAVAPGWIATASSSEAERVAGVHTPVGRPGTPDEVAAAVCFLASRAASYITGQALVVDGGNIVQESKVP